MKDTVDLLRAFAACFAILCPAAAGAQEAAANVAIQWNQAALHGVRDSKLEGACRLDPNRPATIRLDACRPDPVTPEEKAALVASLPTTGEVLVTGAHHVEKLDSVRRILRFFLRDAIYDIRIIDVPEAWAGLYGRAVLLISLPMFRILDQEELAAVAAHEAGHEYVWEAFEGARRGNEKASLQQLELTCDAIAAIALTSVGIAPNRLVSGLDRAFTYNHARFGIPRNLDRYPPRKERRQVALGAGGAYSFGSH